MLLLVGLGNFGNEYQNTRHNAGFILIDEIAKKYSAPSFTKKFHAEISQFKCEEHMVIAAKPQTYMNRSGIAVAEIKKFYKTPIEDIFVFHDDIDIELGRIKIKTGGGAGGHNGLKSIDEFIGKNYHRIRIGVGRNEIQTSNHVLGTFNKQESEILEAVNDKILKFLPLLLAKDFEGFSTKFYL